MTVTNYNELSAHFGHDIQCVKYGEANVALECTTCHEILVDFNSDIKAPAAQKLCDEVSEVIFKVVTNEYVTYEFTTREDIFEPESEGEYNLFRLFICANGDKEIFVANSDDFDIHEDISHAFDIAAIEAAVMKFENVPDITEEYHEHYRNREMAGDNA